MTSLSLSPEIPDSQDVQKNPSTPRHDRNPTSRDDRIAIQTALRYNISPKSIHRVLGFSKSQIEYIKNHKITPQGHSAGREPIIRTPQRSALDMVITIPFSPSNMIRSDSSPSPRALSIWN